MRHRAVRLLNILAVVPVVAAAATVVLPRSPALAAVPVAQPVVIAIDPGHGGTANDSHPEILFDPGVVAKNGLLEKDITLDVARRVRTALEADGVKVVMTRDGDSYVDISPRMEAANRAGAALFVSIHFNYFPDPAIGGSLVLYPNDASLAFAQVMTTALDKRVSGFDLKSNPPVLDNKLWVHAQMPAVTLEAAYLTNAHDADLLKRSELRNAIAAAVRDGVEVQAPEILQRKAEILAQRANLARAAAAHPPAIPSFWTPSPPWVVAVMAIGLLVIFRRRTLPLLTAIVGGGAAFVAARLGYVPARGRRRRSGRRHAPPPTWTPPPRRARRRPIHGDHSPSSRLSRHR